MLRLPLLLCLALSACDGVSWPLEAHTTDEVSCPGTSSKDRKDQESNQRQCRSAQTDANVERQQVLHDKGMSIPQPW